MFSHICKTYYPLFFLVVHMYLVWWGLHDTLIPLDSTYASPGPPKMKTKIWKNVHQITSVLYILLSFGVILRCLWGLEAYLYNVYEFCWPMYSDLGRPGDTFAVAGDRAIKFFSNIKWQHSILNYSVFLEIYYLAFENSELDHHSFFYFSIFLSLSRCTFIFAQI